ncbi:hypothetical protein, partial [Blastococcus sp. SYSU D00820]
PPAAPTPGPVAAARPGHGLSRNAGRLWAAAFALAWLVCPAVEPMPHHDAVYPLWQLPVDVAAVGTIVGAVAALWRGSRHSAPLAVAAGCLMAVETILCPLAGHTPVGWWTWVQTAMSLAVMAAGTALYRLRPVSSR